jgi:cell wall-associated NlpC family hydrolase
MHLHGWLTGFLAAVAVACAAPAPPVRPHTARAVNRATVVQTATAMIGTPYRYGGSSPWGFDCSGLVVYSYAKAGLDGLPHSAAALWRLATPISLDELKEGDLLFFRLSGRKTSHVAIYVGDRAFVHAPSGGKRVEKVGFDDFYWSRKLGRAGRLVP